jgi:hypothetical protein
VALQLQLDAIDGRRSGPVKRYWCDNCQAHHVGHLKRAPRSSALTS